MIFRRKGDDAQETSGDGELADELTDSESEADEDVTGDEAAPVEFDRAEGPFDLTEVDEPDAMAAERIDLGAVQIPLVDGLEIRVEIDQEANEPAAVTLIRGEGAVQVRAFSAPRSGGTWGNALAELKRSVTQDGGTVDQAAGPFGTELTAAMPAADEKGNRVLQHVRFVGVEGPRWMLQGVLLGEGAVPERAAALEEVFRSIVVVRGDEAMPPGVMLSLVLPEQVPGDVTELDSEDLDDPDDPDEPVR